MPRTQVTGEEIQDNSVKGTDVDDSTLDASVMPFNDVSFFATTLKAAIIEAKAAAELGFPHIIAEDTQAIVKENRQVINYGGLEIFGELQILGSLVFI